MKKALFFFGLILFIGCNQSSTGPANNNIVDTTGNIQSDYWNKYLVKKTFQNRRQLEESTIIQYVLWEFREDTDSVYTVREKNFYFEDASESQPMGLRESVYVLNKKPSPPYPDTIFFTNTQSGSVKINPFTAITKDSIQVWGNRTLKFIY